MGVVAVLIFFLRWGWINQLNADQNEELVLTLIVRKITLYTVEGEKLVRKVNKELKIKEEEKLFWYLLYNTSTNISKYPFTSDSMQSCKRNSRYKMNKKCNHEDWRPIWCSLNRFPGAKCQLRKWAHSIWAYNIFTVNFDCFFIWQLNKNFF